MFKSLQTLSESDGDGDDIDGDDEEDKDMAVLASWKLYAMTVGGLVGLLIGSDCLVEGASEKSRLQWEYQKVSLD